MIRRATLPLLLASLWILAPAPARALEQATAQAEEEDALADSPDERWGLKLGLQGDLHSSVGATGALSYDLYPATTLRAAGYASDDGGNVAPGVASAGRSISAEVGATQHFGRFGVDLDIGHWTSTGVLSADEIKLGGRYLSGGFSGGLRAGYRRSRFDSFATATVVDFGNGVHSASTTASCRVANTAFGADGRWQGAAFGAHAALMAYQYGDARCGFYAAGLGSVRVSQSAAVFAALAAAPLARLQNSALPVIGEQPSLARTFSQFGISWKRADKGLALDYLRQEDYFLGGVGYAVFATASANLGGSTGVDVSFGRSRGGGAPRGVFGGLGLRARF